MARLTLNLLGTPEVLHDGRSLSFRTRKALALLFYLVVEGLDGTQMHTREKIATFFWPESDRKAGRATLRSTLLYLRNAVAHESGDTTEQSHLIVERNALGFNFDSDYTLDVETVENAVGVRRAVLLQEAVDAYRGNFLEGFSLPDAPAFDDWMAVQREQWHRRVTQLFDRLSHRQSHQGQHTRAIETATRWVIVDPYDERAYRRLMKVQFTAGNRAAALQAYDRCRDMLDREFGATPAPETEALAERIRQESPSERRQSDEPETERRLLLRALPFHGRTAEHAALVRAFYAARDDTAQVVALTGDAGIGKTRLAREFLSWARSERADVIRGRAFEAGGRLPYQPIVDALRPRIDRENAPEDLLSDVWLAEVSRLLPELYDRYPDLPSPTTDESTTQTRLLEAVSRLCMALAERRPLVIFIDDLQWADVASLDLLQYAVRRWHDAGSSIILLTTVRAGALAGMGVSGKGGRLRDWFTGLDRDVPLTRVTLAPLSEQEVLDLVETLAEAEEHGSRGAGQPGRKQPECSPAPQHPGSSAQFAEWLYGETQGHPFYIAETLNALLEEGVLTARNDESERRTVALAEDGSTWAPPEAFVAPRVREVVRGRLAKMDPDTFDLLAAGAVLGHDFSSEALWRVADQSPVRGIRALDELLAGRLLIEAGEAGNGDPATYRFTHDKIRDVTYTEAGDARRHLFHKRALTYLEARNGAPAQLAHHAQAARLDEATFQYSLDAGDEAMDLYAVRDAIEHYETARRALVEHPGVSDQVPMSRRRHLYERLGRACELVNEWERAREVYHEMRVAAWDADAPAMEVAALNHLADLAMQQYTDIETARELLTEASQLAEEIDDRAGLARAEWCLARVEQHSLQREQSIAHGERALILAREVADEELIARALSILSYAKHGAVSLSMLRDAEAHAREAAVLFARQGNRAMEVDSLIMEAAVHLHAGQPQQAEKVAHEAREIAVEINNVWGQVNTGFNLAQALFESGRWGEALALIDETVTLAEDHAMTMMLGGVLGVRGNFYAALLAHERALVDHERAYALFQKVPNPHIARVLTLDMSAACVAVKDWAGAYRHALEALRIEGSTWLFSWFRYWYLVEALLHEGDVARARAAVEGFGKRIGNNPRYAIPHRRSLALLAREEDGASSAIKHLKAAVDVAKEHGLPGELWQIYAELGTVYAEMGKETQAGTVRADADKIVEQLTGTLSEELAAHFRTAARQRIFPEHAVD